MPLSRKAVASIAGKASWSKRGFTPARAKALMKARKRKANNDIVRGLKSLKMPKQSKQRVPGMRGKAKVPKGMRTNRQTGTRLYPE
jgi:hypothetical protein